ncbi:MAG: MerR family DNA-binding protein [Lachnospiraceae bacterium]
MSLKDIREYINLAMQGDETIDERLALFEKQRKNLEAQMEELQHTMDVLNFKCWYYETAKKAGTTLVPQCMEEEEIPEEFKKIREELHCKPECN